MTSSDIKHISCQTIRSQRSKAPENLADVMTMFGFTLGAVMTTIFQETDLTLPIVSEQLKASFGME